VNYVTKKYLFSLSSGITLIIKYLKFIVHVSDAATDLTGPVIPFQVQKDKILTSELYHMILILFA
jgi:hypothetical protein